MTDTEYVSNLVSRYPNGKIYVNTPYSHRLPVVICDGVKTRNVKFATMAHEIADMYKNHPSTIEDGLAVTGNSVYGQMNQVLQDSSYLSNPLSSLIPHIKREIDKDFLKIFEHVAYLFGREWVMPDAIRVNKKSRSGFPCMEFDIHKKLDMWLKFYNKIDDGIVDMLKLYDRTMTSKQFLEKYDFTFLKMEGRRFQETDKINYENGRYSPRLREVYDWKGKQVKQIRDIAFYPKNLPMWSIRDRLLWSFSLQLTIFSGFFAEGNRLALKRKYPFAFRHVRNQFVKEMTTGGFIYFSAGDIRNFDQYTPYKIMETYFRSQAYMTEAIQRIHLIYGFAPAFIKNSYLNEHGVALIGGLGKLDHSSWNGHPTGYAYVSNMNEAMGYAVSLTILHKAGLINALDTDEIVRILHGTHPDVRLKSKGDDNIMTFRNSSSPKKVSEIYETWDTPYPLAEERPAKFLGSLFTKMNDGSIKAAIDSRNFIIKFLVPEKSSTHIQNMLWKLGWKSRYSDYDGPGSIEMQVLLRRMLMKHFNVDIDSSEFITMTDREKARLKLLQAKATNIAELMFLSDSTYIWKYDDTDISEDVLAMQYLSLPTASMPRIHRYLTR